MTHDRLHHLLATALLSALVPACGGVVEDPGRSDGGSDAAADTGHDGAVDVATDLGVCTPIADNTTCSEKVTYPCGLPIVLAGATPTTAECKTLCAPIAFTDPGAPYYCNVYPTTTDGPSRTVSCASCAVGRKPLDLEDDTDACVEEDPVGEALAAMARIEAASVHAFRKLERTLRGLGAPAALVARARRAARDEARHARLVGGLATARGARRRPVRTVRGHVPTVFELALENAVEGCVHETIGVAYLEHQRVHATTPELRAMAADLHDDELAHAALSWELRAFFDAHLDDTERAELQRARDAALATLPEEMARLHPTVRTTLGLPDAACVARLVEGLKGSLYAA